jgi:hypothetical protein
MQFEHVSQVFFEPVGPEMRAGLAVDKLRVDAHMSLDGLWQSYWKPIPKMPSDWKKSR